LPTPRRRAPEPFLVILVAWHGQPSSGAKQTDGPDACRTDVDPRPPQSDAQRIEKGVQSAAGPPCTKSESAPFFRSAVGDRVGPARPSASTCGEWGVCTVDKLGQSGRNIGASSSRRCAARAMLGKKLVGGDRPRSSDCTKYENRSDALHSWPTPLPRRPPFEPSSLGEEGAIGRGRRSTQEQLGQEAASAASKSSRHPPVSDHSGYRPTSQSKTGARTNGTLGSDAGKNSDVGIDEPRGKPNRPGSSMISIVEGRPHLWRPALMHPFYDDGSL